jgi:hypothetical protein
MDMIRAELLQPTNEQPIITATNSNFLNVDKVSETGIGVIDWVTKLPGRITKAGEALNDDLVEIANRFRKGEDVAERNLTENYISNIGSRSARWLSKPLNLAIAAGAIFFAIYLIRK